MAGHMGDVRVTTHNLTVVSTDVERGLILVRGAVPGSKGGYVLIRDAMKTKAPEGLPYPGSVRAPVALAPIVDEPQGEGVKAEVVEAGRSVEETASDGGSEKAPEVNDSLAVEPEKKD
jgi:hypothetical protein